MPNQEIKNPWLIKKKVLPQHTDQAGVMWHGSYLNWLEESRIEALSQTGLSYSNISKMGIEMPVVDINIKYKKSIYHGEIIVIKTWLEKKKGVRLYWKSLFIKNDYWNKCNI